MAKLTVELRDGRRVEVPKAYLLQDGLKQIGRPLTEPELKRLQTARTDDRPLVIMELRVGRSLTPDERSKFKTLKSDRERLLFINGLPPLHIVASAPQQPSGSYQRV